MKPSKKSEEINHSHRVEIFIVKQLDRIALNTLDVVDNLFKDFPELVELHNIFSFSQWLVQVDRHLYQSHIEEMALHHLDHIDSLEHVNKEPGSVEECHWSSGWAIACYDRQKQETETNGKGREIRRMSK